jgi:hypothetical protein
LLRLLKSKISPQLMSAWFFESSWLASYPKPDRCVHDNSREFIGARFLRILAVNGIKENPTMIKNPQAKANCKRMHQTVEVISSVHSPMLNWHRIFSKWIIWHYASCTRHVTRCICLLTWYAPKYLSHH